MPKTIILSFDDAVVNHRTYVAPLLKERGFNATFFICQWTEEWRREHLASLMTSAHLQELSAMGFDIGNHTWNHASATTVSTEEFLGEVDKLEGYLEGLGIPKAVSFAYPGGPYYTPAVIAGLKERGFLCARSVENAAYDPEAGDPMVFPAIPFQDEVRMPFEEALALCTEDHPLAILFHGVPDKVHPWVTQDPDVFVKYLDFLKDGGYRVISFRDYMTR